MSISPPPFEPLVEILEFSFKPILSPSIFIEPPLSIVFVSFDVIIPSTKISPED